MAYHPTKKHHPEENSSQLLMVGGVVIGILVLALGAFFLGKHQAPSSANPITIPASWIQSVATLASPPFSIAHPSEWSVDQNSSGINFYYQDTETLSMTNDTASQSVQVNFDALIHRDTSVLPAGTQYAGTPERLTINGNAAVVAQISQSSNARSSGAVLDLLINNTLYTMNMPVDSTGNTPFASQRATLLELAQSLTPIDN